MGTCRSRTTDSYVNTVECTLTTTERYTTHNRQQGMNQCVEHNHMCIYIEREAMKLCVHLREFLGV